MFWKCPELGKVSAKTKHFCCLKAKPHWNTDCVICSSVLLENSPFSVYIFKLKRDLLCCVVLFSMFKKKRLLCLFACKYQLEKKKTNLELIFSGKYLIIQIVGRFSYPVHFQRLQTGVHEHAVGELVLDRFQKRNILGLIIRWHFNLYAIFFVKQQYSVNYITLMWSSIDAWGEKVTKISVLFMIHIKELLQNIIAR